MKKVNKVLGSLALGAAVLTTSSIVSANPVTQQTDAAILASPLVSDDSVIHGEVGEMIVDGNYIYQRLPDNSTLPKAFFSRASTEGFVVSNFGGNTSLDKTTYCQENLFTGKFGLQTRALLLSL